MHLLSQPDTTRIVATLQGHVRTNHLLSSIQTSVFESPLPEGTIVAEDMFVSHVSVPGIAIGYSGTGILAHDMKSNSIFRRLLFLVFTSCLLSEARRSMPRFPTLNQVISYVKLYHF